MRSLVPEFIVRVWVDLKIVADNAAAAKQIAYKHSIDVARTAQVEEYDQQVAEAWEREPR